MTSIFWYDYETTGINPRCDRAVQVAGIRTDVELNEIDQPLNLYCHLSEDILPHPAACLVTGITPSLLADKGLDEAEFITRTHAQLALPVHAGQVTTRCVSMMRSRGTAFTETSLTLMPVSGKAVTPAGI